MLNTVGRATTFRIYAALNAGFIALASFFVQETRGVPLERIEQNLDDWQAATRDWALSTDSVSGRCLS